MKRVVTYTNPFGLAQHPTVGKMLPNTLHICATVSLRKGMDEQYDKQFPFVEAQEVLDTLLGEWNADRTRVTQLARLSALCELHRTAPPGAPISPDLWERHMRAFIRNLHEALLAMRILTEASIHPAELNPQTADEHLFKFLWERLETQRSFANVRARISTTFQDPAQFRQHLWEAVPEALNRRWPRNQPTDKTRIIFHGFYFITPLQYQLISWCEQAGIEVLFLNNWDPRAPHAFKAWESFFQSSNGLPGPDEWEKPEPCQAPCPVGDLLEGRLPQAPIPARILRHDSFGALVRQVVEEIDDPERPTLFYTPEEELLGRFLREYRPGDPDKQDRHFLAYPVGQLLFHLHQMWDRETKSLRLQGRPLVESFASGWLQTADGTNGRDLVRALEAMLPFFEGCDSLHGWEERATLLLQVRTEIVPLFQHPELPSQQNKRFHRFLHNPLEHFAHFQVDEQQVHQVIALMQHLFGTARQLFDNGEVALSEHFANLERLLLQGADSFQIERTEQKLVKDLLKRMHSLTDESERFLPGDLAMAISYYLGGKLERQQEEGADVFAFAQLDGAPMQAKDSPVHICLLGETSLPKRKRAFPWPLTAQTFAHMPDHQLVRLLTLREAESANADRYLLYFAVTWTPEIVLSYAASVGGEPVGPSPYLVLLEPFCRSSEASLRPFSARREAAQEDWPAVAPSRPDANETFPPDALAEFTLCPRRFYYSFLAQTSPAFASDFHHGFLYGNLVKSLAQVGRQDEAEVAKEVDRLFPQWPNEVKRQDLLERSYSAYTGNDRYDGTDYPRARLGLEFLVPRMEEMRPAIRLFDEVEGIDLQREQLGRLALAMHKGQALLPAEPLDPKLCRFCPHVSRCADAHHPVDDEEGGR